MGPLHLHIKRLFRFVSLNVVPRYTSKTLTPALPLPKTYTTNRNPNPGPDLEY